MYFLWKRTPIGSIRVSGSGFTDCISSFLPEKTRCRSLAVAEGESAAMTLVLSGVSGASPDCGRIEKRLAAITAPLGFTVKVIWADRGTPGAELSEGLSAASRSPWAWMLAASLITLKIAAGWNGFFWTLFWGAAAWFASKAIIAALSRRQPFIG